MLPIGTPAPDFKLLDPSTQEFFSLNSFSKAPALLVMFICNHCPYVKHFKKELAAFCADYSKKGAAIVGINSNDAEEYPEDSPEKMALEKKTWNYSFPYLFDSSQSCAKSYDAACTPDFFLFDKNRKLVYRGQFDDSRPGNGKPITGKDLGAALDAVLRGESPTTIQNPSIGCNIKWRS